MNIVIDKYEKNGKGKYRLFLGNGEVIDTYDDVILENELLLKKSIDTSTYDKIMKDNNIVEYYNMACKYISIRLRSTKEIKDYLIRKGINSCDIDIVIDKLVNNKILNDDIFTEAFIKDKLRFSNMGEYRIINELKKHNIDSDIINKYSYLIDEDVMSERVIKLVDKQIRINRKLDNYKLRNKIYNNLMGLGYSSNTIVSVLNNYFE